MLKNKFGNKEAYIKAFKILLKEGIPENHIRILQKHYKSPNNIVTWSQLAKAVGYPNGNTINLQYGKLAHRVAHLLGISKPPNNFWLFVLVDWSEKKDPCGHTTFVLRPAVVKALIFLKMI